MTEDKGQFEEIKSAIREIALLDELKSLAAYDVAARYYAKSWRRENFNILTE